MRPRDRRTPFPERAMQPQREHLRLARIRDLLPGGEPDKALEWAEERADRILKKEGRTVDPFVVGAAIDPGFRMDLISSNGIHAVETTYPRLSVCRGRLRHANAGKRRWR
jgi:hypothetical protein